MSALSSASSAPSDPAPKLPSAAWAAIDLSPFIAYWLLASFADPRICTSAALAVSVGLTVRHLANGRVKPLAALGMATFGALLIGSLVGVPSTATYGPLAVSTLLGAVAVATLLVRVPLTFLYSRDDWHPVTWDEPMLLRGNMLATAAEAAIFGVQALLAAAAVAAPQFGLPLLLSVAGLGIAAAAVPMVIMIQYARQGVGRMLAERDPYHWSPPHFGISRPMDADVVVVGAGVGGLTAAALLADRGLRVVVAEQHFLPGGFCTSWERGVRQNGERLRYVFDAGVHDFSGLAPNAPIGNLLKRLRIEDQIEWRPVRHEYDVDGFHLKVPPRAEDFVAALGDAFPSERTQVAAFFAEVERIYRQLYADAAQTGGVPRLPATPDEMLAYPLSHPHAFHWMNRPFGELIDTYLSDPRLKHTVSVLSEYLSDNPRALSVMGMAPIFGYYFDGGAYPVGGSQAFPNALVRVIRRRGGEVRLRTPVRRILVEDGRAVGIELASGERISANAVIANSDVRRTFLELVGADQLPAPFAQRVAALKPSTSAFAVFLGLDFVPDLEPLVIVSGGAGPFGVAIPSKVDPGLAPPGHSAVSLVRLVPQAEACTWDRTAPDYHARKRSEGDRLIGLAERLIPDLRRHIVYRQEGTPQTFGRYAWSSDAAIYGPAAGQWQVPPWSPIEGLVLAGNGVFPGAGVEAAVISGTVAADCLYGAARTIDRISTLGRVAA